MLLLLLLLQESALVQRLGAERAPDVQQYITRMPADSSTKLTVASNPLMLSMIASVFELRQGLPVPQTAAELYSTASDTMLARGGGASAELRRLVQVGPPVGPPTTALDEPAQHRCLGSHSPLQRLRLQAVP